METETEESEGRGLGGATGDQSHQSRQIEPKEKKRKTKTEAAVPAIKQDITINHLPLDCLSHIFSYLSVKDLLGLPAVCKTWRELESIIWRDIKKLDLISLEKSKNPSSFMSIGSKENNKKTRLRFTTGYSRLLSLSGRFLRVLTIPVVPQRYDILPIAADQCQSLRKIVVRFEFFSNKTRQCRDLQRLIVKNRETLRSVVIDNLGTEFDSYNQCLLQLPEELVELQLWGFKARYSRFTERDITVSFHDFVPAIKRLKNLQILVLNGMQIPPEEISMIENFPDLRCLELYRSNRFPLDPRPISSRTKLEYLSLDRVSNMNTRWFADLVRNNPNLKHLKLQASLLKPECIVQLFPLSKLETLNLIKVSLPEYIDLSGFHNLRKFVCNTIGDRAVINLMETALNLTMLILKQSKVTFRVLNKAHKVTSYRTNDVPLHVVVDDIVITTWQKPKGISGLLTVESRSDYNRRTRDGFEGNEEEIFY